MNDIKDGIKDYPNWTIDGEVLSFIFKPDFTAIFEHGSLKGQKKRFYKR